MFAKKLTNSKSGFSLPELLVTIAIIGTLSTIAILSVNSVRATARDVKRVADLEAIEAGLQLYHNKYGTYLVANSGWRNCGCGWVGYQGGPDYLTAVTQVLNSDGFLATPILDDVNAPPGYMLYLCNANQEYALYATKEKPTAKDIAYTRTTCAGVWTNDNYGKNFTVTNKP